MIVLAIPLQKLRKYFHYFRFVTDKVVIDNEYLSSVSGFEKSVKFPQQLGRCLGPRPAPKQHGDIAELTVVGTPSGELDRHGHVVVDVEQIKTRSRGLGDVGFHR